MEISSYKKPNTEIQKYWVEIVDSEVGNSGVSMMLTMQCIITLLHQSYNSLKWLSSEHMMHVARIIKDSAFYTGLVKTILSLQFRGAVQRNKSD